MVTGWDFSEGINNDEESESSDEDFELRMITDTDNEDVGTLQAEILKGEEDE
jgi:hypothetical protein